MLVINFSIGRERKLDFGLEREVINYGREQEIQIEITEKSEKKTDR